MAEGDERGGDGRDAWRGSALSGRAAVVTGGTSGIGLAVVRRFREAGASVVALARRGRPEVEATGAAMVECDVADESAVAAAFATAADLVGPLDVVVLNAGISELDGGGTDEMDTAAVRRMLEVNTMGVFHGLREAPAHMRDGGSIVITSTAALWWPFPDYMAYTASKAPLSAMCVHAAMKLGPRGIRVNTVSPGTIVTEMQPADDPEARINPFATCLGRVGVPDDVVGAYHFLASDDSRYVTATDLRVDGGWLGGLTYAQAEALLDR
jgi:NAD(P)-dependent dehydrogenase (short-subunit alcohol dehydrogenase family)